MFYVDSQKTLVRRDSSLIRTKSSQKADATTSTVAPLASDSGTTELNARPRGMVQKELVTMMFESMLGCIVQSWEPILSSKNDETSLNTQESRTTIVSVKKKDKKPVASKSLKLRKSSKVKEEEAENNQEQGTLRRLDERAIIRFHNGNSYEGNIYMKCMHGEGRFQWADGTVYLGTFVDNVITGHGIIQWKDDTWYEGEFHGNIRHGKGLYVNSRLQSSYMGGWQCGTKHGQGTMYYGKDFKNSYDGHWINNERFGFGVREYSETSGYIGEWHRNLREGKGLMIWPNNDCYNGEWKNGVMSGSGIYVWNTHYNNSMSVPSLKAYRGTWEKGTRNGFGRLNFGSGLGSYYKGEFKNNLKHGKGQLVTNVGLILEDKQLFLDDNVCPSATSPNNAKSSIKMKNIESNKLRCSVEPHNFDIYDDSAGLADHIAIAIKNIDRREEIITKMIQDYFQNNKLEYDKASPITTQRDKKIVKASSPTSKIISASSDERYDTKQSYQQFLAFEETSLKNAITCYTSDLRNIYYKYATVCNTEEINFTPIMIRLYLWQMYYDCKIHHKGLTLYEIDEIYNENHNWLAKRPHDPFEKIYFWQFLHSLLSVATTLYAKRKMPGRMPDTIVAKGFRTFMEQDLLPSCNIHNGRLVNNFGTYVPLKATYELYERLGQPPTIRRFIKAVRRSTHFLNRPQPPIIDCPDKLIPWGHNLYVFGDDLVFTLNSDVDIDQIRKPHNIETHSMHLFNLANVSIKTIINIFAKIFPQVLNDGKIMDLEVKITFFEFFEAFIACVEESIKIKEEEIKWRQKFSDEPMLVPQSSPIDSSVKH